MTTKQQETYERMLTVVEHDHLNVHAGTVRATGAAIYAVPSRSEANRYHLVSVSGHSLTCDCRAASFGKSCCHRAAVRQYLENAHEAQIEAAFHSAAAALSIKLDALGPRPHTSTREFSVFK